MPKKPIKNDEPIVRSAKHQEVLKLAMSKARGERRDEAANQVINAVFKGEHIEPQDKLKKQLLSTLKEFDVASIISDPDKKNQVVEKIKEIFQNDDKYRDLTVRPYKSGDLLKGGFKALPKEKPIVTIVVAGVNKLAGRTSPEEKHYNVPVNKINDEIRTISTFLENEANIPRYAEIEGSSLMSTLEKYNSNHINDAILKLNQKELNELAQKALNQPPLAPAAVKPTAVAANASTHNEPPPAPTSTAAGKQKPPPPKGPSPRDKANAAIKIQKTARGYNVRKKEKEGPAI
jgi:hypothetical protein